MKPPIRSRWKTVAAVLMLGIVASFLLIGKMRARTHFRSKPVSASAYRCRFTLSSAWKQETPTQVQSGWPASGEYAGFTLAQSPVRQWIDSRLLHKPAATLPSLSFISYTVTPAVGLIPVINGYPELPVNRSAQVITHRHIRLDGYAATVLTVEFASKRTTGMVVYVPEQSIMYLVVSGAETARFSQVDDEMQAIITSFHIEKGAMQNPSR